MPSVVALYIILIHILAVYVVCRRLIKQQDRMRMTPAIFPPLPGHMICLLARNVFETNAIRKKIMDDKRHYS
jgi:hypothetical protein